MSNIYNTSGGYRKLHAFNFATIIHLGTISFCKRYLSWKDDPLGKMLGQMVGASRSGKQNMIEGSERAKTSSETEIKLIDVAKASLSELQGDLEDDLVQKGHIPWSVRHADHQAVLAIMLDEFDYTDDLLHDLLDLPPQAEKEIRSVAREPGRCCGRQRLDHPDPTRHRLARPPIKAARKRFPSRRRVQGEDVPSPDQSACGSRQPRLSRL